MVDLKRKQWAYIRLEHLFLLIINFYQIFVVVHSFHKFSYYYIIIIPEIDSIYVRGN